jgi:hypothetical protein
MQVPVGDTMCNGADAIRHELRNTEAVFPVSANHVEGTAEVTRDANEHGQWVRRHEALGRVLNAEGGDPLWVHRETATTVKATIPTSRSTGVVTAARCSSGGGSALDISDELARHDKHSCCSYITHSTSSY